MESTINKEAETPKSHRKKSPKQCEFITNGPGLSGGRHKIVLKLMQLIRRAYIQVYKVLLSWLSCFIRKKPPKTAICRRCQRRNWNSSSCRKCRKKISFFTNLESSYFRSEQLCIHEVQYQPNTFGKQCLSINESFMSNADLNQYGDSSNFRNLHRTEIYSFGSPTILKERNTHECFWLREADRIVAERYNPRMIAKRINAQSDTVLLFGEKRKYPGTFWEREMRIIRSHRLDPIPKRQIFIDFSDDSDTVSEQLDPRSPE